MINTDYTSHLVLSAMSKDLGVPKLFIPNILSIHVSRNKTCILVKINLDENTEPDEIIIDFSIEEDISLLSIENLRKMLNRNPKYINIVDYVKIILENKRKMNEVNSSKTSIYESNIVCNTTSILIDEGVFGIPKGLLGDSTLFDRVIALVPLATEIYHTTKSDKSYYYRQIDLASSKDVVIEKSVYTVFKYTNFLTLKTSVEFDDSAKFLVIKDNKSIASEQEQDLVLSKLKLSGGN